MSNQHTPRTHRKGKPPRPETLAAIKANSKVMVRKKSSQLRLTADMIPKIASLMLKSPRRAVAEAFGFSDHTLEAWLRKGATVEQLPEGTMLNANEVLYWDLFQAVSVAKAELVEKHVANIEKVAMTPSYHSNGQVRTAGDWTASMTLLERLFPERFAKRSVLSGTGPGGAHMLAVGALDELLGGGEKPLIKDAGVVEPAKLEEGEDDD